mgnify:CR=1 FL=1
MSDGTSNVILIDPNTFNINNRIVNSIPQYQNMYIFNDKIEINQEIPENEYSMEENIKNDNFSEIEYIENETIEKENEIIVEKPKKSIADLSKSEYRQYLRTGIIPE